MQDNQPTTTTAYVPGSIIYPLEPAPLPRFTPWLRFGRGNGRSQATVRRAVRRRSNLPKAIQKRLGFKCH